MNQAPILLMTYRRFENTKLIFNLLKEYNQKKIYVFNDGLKNKLHFIDHSKTRNYLKLQKKKFKEIELILPKKNLTQKKNLPFALEYVFKKDNMAIIIEDDCIPSKDYFKFTNILLNKFKNDLRIAQISGVNLINHRGFKRRNNDSYFFSKFTSSWGWATWRDRWMDVYDENIKTWPKIKKEKWLKDILIDKKSIKFWEKYLDRRYKMLDDDWDKPWTLVNLINNRLSIYPSKNLINNIGEDRFALHQNPKKWNNVKLQNISFPLKHPKIITQDREVDNFITSEGFSNPGLFFRVKNKLKKYFR